MAQHQRATATGANHVTTNAVEGAMNALNATSKNIQAMASEVFVISKQSIEHATHTMDKLHSARGVDEVVEIQTNFVKETFENATKHARIFGELISGFPSEITKAYQDAWLKAVNAAAEATQVASQTTAENVKSYSEAARVSLIASSTDCGSAG